MRTAQRLLDEIIRTNFDVSKSDTFEDFNLELIHNAVAMGAMTYYEIFSIFKDAGSADFSGTSNIEFLKNAYKIIGLRLHPDKNVSDTPPQQTLKAELFKLINNAKDVIFDSDIKAQYDLFLNSVNPSTPQANSTQETHSTNQESPPTRENPTGPTRATPYSGAGYYYHQPQTASSERGAQQAFFAEENERRQRAEREKAEEIQLNANKAAQAQAPRNYYQGVNRSSSNTSGYKPGSGLFNKLPPNYFDPQPDFFNPSNPYAEPPFFNSNSSNEEFNTYPSSNSYTGSYSSAPHSAQGHFTGKSTY